MLIFLFQFAENDDNGLYVTITYGEDPSLVRNLMGERELVHVRRIRANPQELEHFQVRHRRFFRYE